MFAGSEKVGVCADFRRTSQIGEGNHEQRTEGADRRIRVSPEAASGLAKEAGFREQRRVP